MHYFISIGEFKRVTVRKRSIRVKIDNFMPYATLEFDWWPWKSIGHLSYAASSSMHHFITIGEFKMELQSGNAQFGSKSKICLSCVLEMWRTTLKNTRAPLISYIKLCASSRRHMWTGLSVRKSLSGAETSVTLTFDLWPWPFAWTSYLPLENFRMLRWWEHGENGVTDGWTEEQTDRRTHEWMDGKVHS